MARIKKLTAVVDEEQCFAETGAHRIQMSGDEPSPTDLLVASLGGCFALTLRAILQKKRVEVKKVEVDIKAHYSQDPSYFSEIDVHCSVRADQPVDEKVLQDSVQLAEQHCPVHLTYVNEVKINTSCSAEQNS